MEDSDYRRPVTLLGTLRFHCLSCPETGGRESSNTMHPQRPEKNNICLHLYREID